MDIHPHKSVFNLYGNSNMVHKQVHQLIFGVNSTKNIFDNHMLSMLKRFKTSRDCDWLSFLRDRRRMDSNLIQHIHAFQWNL